MKRATLVGLLALAVAALLALPGSALASGHGHHGTHANRGNHCGQGHAKHSRKVGQSCQKLSRHSTNANGGAVNPGEDDEAGDDQDQAGDSNDQDQAGDDQGEVNDDQGDVADDDQGDAADDQGDDAEGD
jgi:hypothetical protein